jgi:apurinic endonuclease APN1
MSKKILYGSHVQCNGNIIESAMKILALKGNFFQIYISDPTSFKFGMPSVTTTEKNDIKQYLSDNNLSLVIHSPYTLNFANRFNKYSRGIKLFIKELKFGSTINAYGCVLHLGKSKLIPRNIIIQNMYDHVIYAYKNSPNNIKIILETSAGQGHGSDIFYNIENLSKLYSMFTEQQKMRIGICIDTCHVFSAGYDISSKEKIIHFFKMFNKLIGLKYVDLIHLNDSYTELGSRIDRHSSLGEGYIGIRAIEYLIEFAIKNKFPLVLETPFIKHKNEILLIKQIINKITQKND